jgi:predicted Mrr-cat superfamily restriction endonuclease
MIAIGWPEMGDLSKIEANREAFKRKYMQVYPDAKKGSVATAAGMLYRFCCETQAGDYINGTELVELVLKYYDKLSEKYRKIIPLEKVYIPVSKEN